MYFQAQKNIKLGWQHQTYTEIFILIYYLEEQFTQKF